MNTRNEAAERLLDYLEEQDGSVDVTIKRTLDDALAAERRAMVQEILGTIKAKRAMYFSQTDSANTLNDLIRYCEGMLEGMAR